MEETQEQQLPVPNIRECDEWKTTMNAMSSLKSQYSRDYVFWLHMISQMKISYSRRLETAGVRFMNDHYEMLVNPEFFAELPMEQRLGLLKHECQHILYGHCTFAKKDYQDQALANIAQDCAINQQITFAHLPTGCILPSNFPSKQKCPEGRTADQYYELLEQDKDEQKMKGSKTLDDHGMWDEGEGDADIAQDVAKSMADKAADATQNSTNPGNLPSNYAEVMDLLTRTSEVDWRKVLRNIVGNKKANRTKTILRRDRRSPHMEHIKGTKRDRIFELLVISDVSGSVSNQQLLEVWGEIINIGKVTNVDPMLIQIDTQAYEPELLKKNTKQLDRKAHGGTILAPALAKAAERKIHYDALVVTTDNYLFDNDWDPFYELKVPVIWLVDSDGGNAQPGQTSGKHRYFKLKKQ